MPVKEEHKSLLKSMGLTEEDFELFDGTHVRYEYDEGKGVRIHDPFYETSYDEYIGIDGWSSWSSEDDTFMHDILKGVHEKADRELSHSPITNDHEISNELRKKFGKPVKDKD